MGYLDNTSVIVDAIITKKGRELLSKNQFNITQFALGDDEIDYTLYNESHPEGSAKYGEAIEALPLIEAIPNENNIMISKLITLPRGTTKIPVLSLQSTNITVGRSGTFTISPSTLNFDVGTESAYQFTIADRRLIQQASVSDIVRSPGGAASTVPTNIPFTGTALSQTFVGTTFTGTALAGSTLFGSNTALSTSIIVIGVDTGARATITLVVNKNVGAAGTQAAVQPRSSY